jgi:hypothetical protein
VMGGEIFQAVAGQEDGEFLVGHLFVTYI